MTNIYYPKTKGIGIDKKVPENVIDDIEQLFNFGDLYTNRNDIELQPHVNFEQLQEKKNLYQYIIKSCFNLYITTLKNFFEYDESHNYVSHISTSWFLQMKSNDYVPLHCHEDLGQIVASIYYGDWSIDKELEYLRNRVIDKPNYVYENNRPRKSKFDFENGKMTEEDYGGDNGLFYYVMNDIAYTHQPEKNSCVLLPGNVLHGVYPFYSDQIRRSFICNVSFYQLEEGEKIPKDCSPIQF